MPISRSITRAARTTLCALAAGTMLAWPLAAPAQTIEPELMGDWYATGSGIVHIAFLHSTMNNALLMRAYGSCSPTPCDWGTVPVSVYAPNVSATTGRTAVATFATTFNSTMVTVTLVGETLRVRAYTRFTDGSGRSNYTTIVDMHR